MNQICVISAASKTPIIFLLHLTAPFNGAFLLLHYFILFFYTCQMIYTNILIYLLLLAPSVLYEMLGKAVKT